LTTTTKSPWGLILILFGAGILSAFQVGKVPPVLADIRSDLAISLFHAGWLLSVFNLTGLLLGTCTGAIADAIASCIDFFHLCPAMAGGHGIFAHTDYREIRFFQGLGLAFDGIHGLC